MFTEGLYIYQRAKRNKNILIIVYLHAKTKICVGSIVKILYT